MTAGILDITTTSRAPKGPLESLVDCSFEFGPGKCSGVQFSSLCESNKFPVLSRAWQVARTIKLICTYHQQLYCRMYPYSLTSENCSNRLGSHKKACPKNKGDISYFFEKCPIACTCAWGQLLPDVQQGVLALEARGLSTFPCHTRPFQREGQTRRAKFLRGIHCVARSLWRAASEEEAIHK